MGILDSIKNILSTDTGNGEFSSIMDRKVSSKMKKMDKEANTALSNGDSIIRIIDISPNLYLACRAAKICVGRTVKEGPIEDRINFISKMMKAGHESVIEHTNIIALLHISNIDNIVDWSELLSNAKFIDLSVSRNSSNILLGGSIRGYLHILRETNAENTYIPYIKEILYQSVEKVFLQSCIDEGLLDQDRCTYYPNATVDMIPSKMTQFKNKEEKESLENKVTDNYDSISKFMIDPKEKQSVYSDMIYHTDINNLIEEIIPYGFSELDAYKMARVSFIFHDISRSCGNQLCRHRDAISQESQRYVSKEYETEDFVNPVYMEFDNTDRYKDSDKEDIKKIIDNIDVFETYNTLRKNKVYKEDARAWLPMNVKTRMMMTFSYWNYAKFLQLRLDKAAQLEIRKVAKDSANHLFDTKDKIVEFINKATKYGFKDREVTNIDDSDIVNDENSIKPMNISDEKNAEKIMNLNDDYKKLGE